jgi:hypothetical protein
MLKIVTGVEPIPVEFPVVLIFGPPGLAKTSLGYSMEDPLLLDFDKGAHRAANRRDTLIIDAWADAAELTEGPAALAPYKSLVVDTVGRCLDAITTDIARTDPKKAPGGALSQQGFGVLKSRFASWIKAVRALGKNVLLVAHDREDKDGDTRIVRPDIIGGSFAEVMKVADFVGYLSLVGKQRVLDFSPSDRNIGKNPGNWAPLDVPPIAKAQDFMRELYAMGRRELGRMSEASAAVAQQLVDWKAHLDTLTVPDAVTAAVAEVKRFTHPIVLAQAKKALLDRATALNFRYDVQAQRFVSAAPVAAATPATPATPVASPLATQLQASLDDRTHVAERAAAAVAEAVDADSASTNAPMVETPAPVATTAAPLAATPVATPASELPPLTSDDIFGGKQGFPVYKGEAPAGEPSRSRARA